MNSELNWKSHDISSEHIETRNSASEIIVNMFPERSRGWNFCLGRNHFQVQCSLKHKQESLSLSWHGLFKVICLYLESFNNYSACKVNTDTEIHSTAWPTEILLSKVSTAFSHRHCRSFHSPDRMPLMDTWLIYFWQASDKKIYCFITPFTFQIMVEHRLSEMRPETNDHTIVRTMCVWSVDTDVTPSTPQRLPPLHSPLASAQPEPSWVASYHSTGSEPQQT